MSSASCDNRFYLKLDVATQWIIVVEGKDIGATSRVENTEEVYSANLHILPEFQGLRIGPRISKDLLAGWRRAGKKVTGQVFKHSRAKTFWARWGAEIVGDTEHRYLLWFKNPNGSDAPREGTTKTPKEETNHETHEKKKQA